mgnify:CR=1 FL=1
MLVLFPVCFDNWNFIENLIRDNLIIVDEKQKELDKKEKFRLIYTLYQGESWIGNVNNNWEGIRYKMNSCFDSKIDFVNFFYVFSEENKVRKIKQEIRNFCKLGNHSIHSVDDEKMSKKLKKIYF